MFENADDHRVPELPSTALSGDNNALSCDDADATFPNAKSVPPPAGCTTPVCADVAGAPAPEPFDAVTRAPIVDPASPATNAYEDAVAPDTTTHPAPPASQRNHSYANDVGEFDHDPVETDNDCPTTTDPETTGKPVFTGTPPPGQVEEPIAV